MSSTALRAVKMQPPCLAYRIHGAYSRKDAYSSARVLSTAARWVVPGKWVLDGDSWPCFSRTLAAKLPEKLTKKFCFFLASQDAAFVLPALSGWRRHEASKPLWGGRKLRSQELLEK